MSRPDKASREAAIDATARRFINLWKMAEMIRDKALADGDEDLGHLDIPSIMEMLPAILEKHKPLTQRQ